MQEYSPHILTIEERKKLLTKWAKEGDGKSIDMLNRMEGIYTEKLDINAKHEIKRTIIVNPTKNKNE